MSPLIAVVPVYMKRPTSACCTFSAPGDSRKLGVSLFGIGWEGSLRNQGAGKGAEIRYFDYANTDQILQHLLDTAYLPQRR